MSAPDVSRGSYRVVSLLYGFFTISGACALVYQLGWVRIFALEFGSTVLAVTTVVAVFMGGLALGSILGGRFSSGFSNSLFAYGCIELSLAVYAFCSREIFSAILNQVGLSGFDFLENIFFLTALRFGVAVLLLLPPTVLMGATLPVLSSGISRRAGEGGFRSGMLYSANTVGGTLGVVIGGLWLLPEYGLAFSLRSTAILNFVIALACMALSMTQSAGALTASDLCNRLDHGKLTKGGGYIPFVAVGLAALGTMACQVIWTRVATLVLGVSVYAFTVVLAVFLAGLGTGSWLVTRILRHRVSDARVFFGWLLLASAFFIQGTGYLFAHLPVWSISLYSRAGFAADGSFLIYVQLLMAAVLMFPPAIIFGGLFPAALASHARSFRDVGFIVGKIYSWNVLGSITGVLLAGFVMLPLLGATRALIACSFLMIGVFLMLRPKISMKLMAVLVFAAVLGVKMPPWDRQVMSSGPHSYADTYRHRGIDSPEALSAYLAKSQEILYYADGLNSTVMVARDRGDPEQENLYIYTDGKIDGSSHFDMPTQRLAAHIPVLLHDSPTRAAVIGMGTGCTAGSAALHPGIHVDIVEIEAKMVEGARLFKAHNHSVHKMKNVDIVINDGRFYLLRNRGVYDVIISVPSNPWLAGSTNLFTSDFFRRAADALRDNGIFAQWLQLYGMEPDSLRMVIRGFIEAFPDAVLATTISRTDVLLVGTKGSFNFDPERIKERLAESRKIEVDLADPRVGIHSVYDLLARIRILPENLRKLAGREGILHTDDHPVLCYRAPLELYRKTRADNEGLIELHATGIGRVFLQKKQGDNKQIGHLSALAEAYERLRPGGAEALATKRLLAFHNPFGTRTDIPGAGSL